MKGHIIAFLGDAAGAAPVAETAEQNGLAAVEVAPERLIFASAGLAVRRNLDGSIVVGDCFRREPAAAPAANGWGNYIAFSARGAVPAVERAPLTGMPLYWGRTPGGLLCGTDPAMVQSLLGAPVVDWGFVAHALAFINFRTDRTGISGLWELLGGTRLLFDGSRVSIVPTWSPWDHVARPLPFDISVTAPLLERSILDCTAAWSAERSDILAELSGGLDSSIVAAALTAADARFSAITFATPDAEGDERRYAREVAAYCGIALREVLHDDRAIDLAALPDRFSPRPGAYSVLGGLDRAFAEAVPDRARPIFGGIGGDSVFHFDSSVAPILDGWAAFGVSRRSFAVLRDVARASGATIWEAMRLGWRAHRAGPRLGSLREAGYLDAGSLPEWPFAHPWDAGEAEASQAKRNHVASVRRILDFLDRPARWEGREVIAPLLSQPVVELCLAVPSGSWFAGGRNRAVARAAFAGRLPAEVVWRRGKGRMEALCAAAYRRQRPALRELLLGGRLAAEGLLDRAAIEAYLARDLVEGDFDYFRLIEIADVERWVRGAENGTRAAGQAASGKTPKSSAATIITAETNTPQGSARRR